MKRKQTNVWMRRGVAPDDTRPVLMNAYSPDGKRLWAANGHTLFQDSAPDFEVEAGKFVDVKAKDLIPFEFDGRFPDCDVVIPRLDDDAYVTLPTVELWQAIKLCLVGVSRKDLAVVRITSDDNEITLHIKRDDIESWITVTYTGNPFAESQMNLWYLHDAVDGLRHEVTLKARFAPEHPNVLKTEDRLAVIMPMQPLKPKAKPVESRWAPKRVNPFKIKSTVPEKV